jgi:cyclophilin family peptidyl-prolyl cis-trans isomerase
MLKLSSLLFIGFAFFSQLVSANTQVMLETTQGNLVIDLYDDEMPITVKNFLYYVDSGFYDRTIFHRVIQNTLAQAGGYTADMAKKERKEPIQNESKETLKNLRGTIAMARLSSPHTATSEFFINIGNNKQFDYQEWNIGYAVFGKITDETMGTVDSINYVQLGTEGRYKDMPVSPIEIIRAYRIGSTPASQPDLPPEAPSTGY